MLFYVKEAKEGGPAAEPAALSSASRCGWKHSVPFGCACVSHAGKEEWLCCSYIMKLCGGSFGGGF